MRFMQRAPDGGKDSGVDGFFVIEIKSLFSIVVLRFRPGAKRENYHSHAFNALTIWLSGRAKEEVLGGASRYFPLDGRIKWTPRSLIHRYIPQRVSWCITFRGPWTRTWTEYAPRTNEILTLTHGRKIIGRKAVPAC